MGARTVARSSSVRAEPARAGRLERDPLEVPVEREVEVEPGLLAVGDDIQPGGQLVVHGGNHRVFLHLGDFVAAKFGQRHILDDVVRRGRRGMSSHDSIFPRNWLCALAIRRLQQP